MGPTMTSHEVQLAIVIGGGAWLLAAMSTSFYASHLGFPAWPVFICALALGFPVVLLVVTIAGGRRPRAHRARDWVHDDPRERPLTPRN